MLHVHLSWSRSLNERHSDIIPFPNIKLLTFLEAKIKLTWTLLAGTFSKQHPSCTVWIHLTRKFGDQTCVVICVEARWEITATRWDLRPGLQNQTTLDIILKFCSEKKFFLNDKGNCYKKNRIIKDWRATRMRDNQNYTKNVCWLKDVKKERELSAVDLQPWKVVCLSGVCPAFLFIRCLAWCKA